MRRLLSISVIVLTALVVPVVARGDPPPLSGSLELLQSQEARIAGKCDPDGTSSLNFTVAGEATGPYPGTFEARGEIVIEPQTLSGGSAANFFNVGLLVSYEEEFAIHSGAVTITGSKSLTTPPPGSDTTGGPINTGHCLKVEDATLSDVLNATGRLAGAQAFTSFQATIQTPEGTFADNGHALTLVSTFRIHGSSVGNFRVGGFFESFIPVATT